jgi:hypothetical protein
MPASTKLLSGLQLRIASWQNRQRIADLARQVSQHARRSNTRPTVAFFNASARLSGLSLNAAFSLLTSWSLRLSGARVAHFVCRSGMHPCVLGTSRQDYSKLPPCDTCTAQSRRLYAGGELYQFEYQDRMQLSAALQGLNTDQLSQFEYPCEFDGWNPGLSKIPLGRLILPSIRWALRRHHLPDDDPTHYLMREYMLSAYNVSYEFNTFLNLCNPAVAVIFNGIMYPEAAARWVAQQRGLRVITHEVGFQRFSAFFTEGQATAYPLRIPDTFELGPEQNARLDAYLEKRFQGKFTMAGIQFWPEMRGLDESFLRRAANFKQLVPVFSNVVFDTSQVHANTLFPHMFAWLDLILDAIRSHPETLFVIRAHPDEMRPGSAKKSRESVQDWVQRNNVETLPNVVFISPGEYISSYELIQRAKFVVVYNSSIGLEATLLGAPVLCGGQARYTQYPIVFFPDSMAAFQKQLETFLQAEKIDLPPVFQRNARRFLYYQLFRASLPFGHFLQTGPRPGFVQLKSFSWRELLPKNSPTMQVLHDGILGQKFRDGETFLMNEAL